MGDSVGSMYDVGTTVWSIAILGSNGLVVDTNEGDFEGTVDTNDDINDGLKLGYWLGSGDNSSVGD